MVNTMVYFHKGGVMCTWCLHVKLRLLGTFYKKNLIAAFSLFLKCLSCMRRYND